MDVADQLQEIGVFFADHGFVSVLEEVAATFVSFVEGYRIPGHQPAHDPAERGRAGAQKDVKMVWDQGPGVTLGLGFFENDCEPIEEGFAVLVISEYLSSFYSPGHNVLEKARSVKSWLAWHGCLTVI